MARIYATLAPDPNYRDALLTSRKHDDTIWRIAVRALFKERFKASLAEVAAIEAQLSGKHVALTTIWQSEQKYQRILKTDENICWRVCRIVYDDPMELRRRFIDGGRS